jgi:hypothetical protein
MTFLPAISFFVAASIGVCSRRSSLLVREAEKRGVARTEKSRNADERKRGAKKRKWT